RARSARRPRARRSPPRRARGAGARRSSVKRTPTLYGSIGRASGQQIRCEWSTRISSTLRDARLPHREVEVVRVACGLQGILQRDELLLVHLEQRLVERLPPVELALGAAVGKGPRLLGTEDRFVDASVRDEDLDGG